VWWCIPVVPALGRLRQKNREFKANQGYTASLSLRRPELKNKQVFSEAEFLEKLI
jgi:hypothetical protein